MCKRLGRKSDTSKMYTDIGIHHNLGTAPDKALRVCLKTAWSVVRSAQGN
jgi:hypothetical protein